MGHGLPSPCPPSRSAELDPGAHELSQDRPQLPPGLHRVGRAVSPSSTQQHLRKYFIVDVGCAGGALYRAATAAVQAPAGTRRGPKAQRRGGSRSREGGVSGPYVALGRALRRMMAW